MGDKYELDRDESGLTAVERTALDILRDWADNQNRLKVSATQLGETMKISRQRAGAIVAALKRKGRIVPAQTSPDLADDNTPRPAHRPRGSGATWMEIK